MNHEIRIRKVGVFFFVSAQAAAFCFSTGPVFLLEKKPIKKSREKQNKRPIFSNTPISFKPKHVPKHGVFFYLKNDASSKKWHEISPSCGYHQDLVGSRSMENVRSWLSVNGSHVQSSVSRRHTDVSMEDAMQDGPIFRKVWSKKKVMEVPCFLLSLSL